MKQLEAAVPPTAPLTLRSKTPDLAPFVGHDRWQRTLSDDSGMEALLSALDSAGAAGSLSRSNSASSITQKAPSTPVISLRLLVPASPHSPSFADRPHPGAGKLSSLSSVWSML